MIDPENDNDQGNEEFSPERNPDGSVNLARERALERNARRQYEDDGCNDE